MFENTNELSLSTDIIISAFISFFSSASVSSFSSFSEFLFQFFINALTLSNAILKSLYVFSFDILSIIESNILFNIRSQKLESSVLINTKQSRFVSRLIFLFISVFFFSKSTFLELISNIIFCFIDYLAF